LGKLARVESYGENASGIIDTAPTRKIRVGAHRTSNCLPSLWAHNLFTDPHSSLGRGADPVALGGIIADGCEPITRTGRDYQVRGGFFGLEYHHRHHHVPWKRCKFTTANPINKSSSYVGSGDDSGIHLKDSAVPSSLGRQEDPTTSLTSFEDLSS